MCLFTCDGSCRGGSSGPGVGDILVGVARGVVWLTVKVAVPAVVAVVAAVALFVAGTALTPRSRNSRAASGATWLRTGAKVARSRSRVHWYAWPGWQRTVARLVLVLVAVAGSVAPLVTVLVLAALILASGTTAVVRRRQAAGPRRVRAVIGDSSRPAISAEPATKWSTWATAVGRKVRVR